MGRTVDRTAQAEREWVDEHADHRREKWEERKQGMDAERRERRAGTSAFVLHKQLVERMAKISTVAAGNVEPGRGGSDRAGPPTQQTFDQDPRWREHADVIRSRLHRMHELLDEAEGLGPVAVKTLLAAEKDKLILDEGVGLSCEGVVAKLGTDVAGSAATVRRVRRAAGMSEKDGLPREPREPRGTVRRVVIDQR